MKVRRSRRTRLRASKSKPKQQRVGKGDDSAQQVRVDQDEAVQSQPPHSLLLASLRFWEVERDLIEERVAAMGR